MEISTFEGFRLSTQQEGVWLTGPLSAPPLCTTLAVLLEGQVSPAEVESAFSQVASRYEILRTIYRKHPGVKLPFQVIVEALRPGSQVFDLSQDDDMTQNGRLEELFRQEQMHTFDLSDGPVLHWVLALLSPGSSVLIVSMPAVSADVRSLRNLMSEVARALRPGVFEGGPEAMQYVDFVQWQQELLVAKEMCAGRDYWRKFPLQAEPDAVWCTEGICEIQQPGEAVSIAYIATELSSDLVERMEEACIRCAVSNSEFLLACWFAELSRYTGNWIPTIGVGFECRRYDELKTALGRFSAFLPLSLASDEKSTFKNYAKAVKKAVAEASKWQESFALELIPGVNMDSGRIVLPYLYEYEDLEGWEGGEGIRYRVLATYTSGERYKLKLVVKRSVSGLRLEFHYAGLEFGAAGIGRLVRNFEQLLQAAMEEPERSVGELRLLGEAEWEQMVVEWNRTDAAYPEECMQELIERQAWCTPERAAVRCGEAGLSYRELNERANRLAHFLRQQGVGRGTLVGLCVERSVEMVVAVLGILKSGGAYVPISAEHPKPRLSKQLAGVGVLISERKWSEQLPTFEGLTLWLDEEPAAWAREAVSNPEAVTTGEDLAYVMYTSGSTGEPKGVEIRHRSVVNYACYISRLLKLEQEPKGLQFAMVSTLAADLGNTCIYPALISGGCLHVLPYAVATDGQRMASYQQQHGLDVLKIVPSHLSALLSSGEGSRLLPKRYLITGGEALPRTLVEAVEASGASCRMINHYGPTETTVGSLVLPLGEYDWKRRSKGAIPLGRPIANTQVYVLDAWGNPCPIGVCGELHIGGAGVARGYLNRPELTGEKFIADGFSKRPGGLLYKTGDLVRYLAEGEIEFLGRMDDQVKIRGYRIEPGEIESVLLRQGEVKQAVVLAREDERREKRLIAYVVVRNQATVSEAELQQRIREQLPDYMVPQAVVLLDKLPLTSNGKVDRQALPKPEEVAGQRKRSYQPPSTLTEQMVAQIWSDVLKVSPIGVSDDFFQLGGHSLLATQVISRIRRAFTVELPLRSLFESSSIAKFSEQIEAARRNQEGLKVPNVTRVSREQILPLSFAQQRLWILDQMQPNNALYNIPRAIRMAGVLNRDAVERSLNEIVRRHEALRTRFAFHDNQPIQQIVPHVTLSVEEVDLSGLPASDRERDAQRVAADEALRPFDLTQTPLLRAMLLRMTPEDHVLLLTMHHIVSDAWSASVFLQEFGVLYTAYSKGDRSPLPELSLQYADYAVWQRDWLQGEALEARLGFWRRQLLGAPPILRLPSDRPRPKVQTFAGGHIPVMLPRDLLEGAKILGAREGVTLFMALLAAFQALLAYHTGEKRIVVGTDVANRPTLDTEGMIGFFINLLPLSTDLSGDPRFLELLQRVRETTLAAYTYQDLPFHKLVEELRPDRSLSHNPLVQVLFVMQNTPPAKKVFSGLNLSRFDVPITHSKFDVAVFANEDANGLQCHWLYSRDLFEQSTIARMATHFENLLRSAIANPHLRLSALEVLGAEEKERGRAAKSERKQMQLKKLLTADPQPASFADGTAVRG